MVLDDPFPPGHRVTRKIKIIFRSEGKFGHLPVPAFYDFSPDTRVIREPQAPFKASLTIFTVFQSSCQALTHPLPASSGQTDMCSGKAVFLHYASLYRQWSAKIERSDFSQSLLVQKAAPLCFRTPDSHSPTSTKTSLTRTPVSPSV